MSTFALGSPLFVLAFAAVTTTAVAAPVGYSISSIGSGSFNGVTFDNALVSIFASGDTSGISGSPTFLTVPVTATVQVAGIGGGSFTDSLEVFVFQDGSNSAVGLMVPFVMDVLDVRNSAFSAYDLSAPFGPITGAAVLNPGSPFATSGGTFVLDSAQESTFKAVPEPASMAAVGLGALSLLRRRKKA